MTHRLRATYRRLAAVSAVGVLVGAVSGQPTAATSATTASASPSSAQSVDRVSAPLASAALTTDRRAPAARAAVALPRLRARVEVGNLDIPWDVAMLPNRDQLITERDRQRILLRTASGAIRVIADRPSGFWSGGEIGLMSIAADPGFGQNGRFYTCTGFVVGGTPEVRVIPWVLNDAHTAATRHAALVTGIQVTSSNHHGGCRIRFDAAGAMYVGTGDAEVGTNPQNLNSLNGKVLRLNGLTGEPWPSNPWVHSANAHRRLVYTYGHRNVQGLALRHVSGGRMWSVEHGPDRDDEVNTLFAGGNYGWNPVPGYDQSTPMTDFSLPGRQIGARWRSGFPTIATSGATWVQGSQWGGYQGDLAVCALKGARLVFMHFDVRGHLVSVRTPPRMEDDFGRLRSVVQDANGDLLVTTSNGGGADVIVRVSPIG